MGLLDFCNASEKGGLYLVGSAIKAFPQISAPLGDDGGNDGGEDDMKSKKMTTDIWNMYGMAIKVCCYYQDMWCLCTGKQ